MRLLELAQLIIGYVDRYSTDPKRPQNVVVKIKHRDEEGKVIYIVESKHVKFIEGSIHLEHCDLKVMPNERYSKF